jgi:alpha-ribazole phosphatase/probable phosphoglycerate mutase
MLTKLYLIRHGETEGAETRRYKGHIDVPLSENGIRQIKKLSEHIIENSSPGLSSVYCSDLSRAVKSAEIIAEEIEEKYPHGFKAWAENLLKFSPLNGETTVEVRDRAMRALDRILKKNKGEEIAVVSHGGIIRIILCELLGIPLENIFRIEQDFAALNIIEFWEMYPVVKLINYVHTIKNI